jgi:hypothetical protein
VREGSWEIVNTWSSPSFCGNAQKVNFGLEGATLFKAVYTLEELERLSQRNGGGARRGCGSFSGPCSKSRLGNCTSNFLISRERPFLSPPQTSIFWMNSPGDPLVRQGNHADCVAGSIAQGGGTYMTSKDMYCHLNMLGSHNCVSLLCCDDFVTAHVEPCCFGG